MRKNIIIMIIAMALAGSTIPLTKMLTSQMPVFITNWISLFFGWLLLLPSGLLFLLRMKTNSIRIRQLGYPALQGLFGMACFRVLTFYGLKYISAVEGGLLTAAGPGLMAIMAFFFLGERQGKSRLFAIVFAALGIGIMQWHKENLHFTFTGTFLILSAMTCETLLTIFRKKASTYIPPAANTFLIISFCMLYLLPMVIIEGQIETIRTLSLAQISGCLYLGAFATVIAYICWGYAAPKLDAGITGIITGMIPLTATALSIIVIGEELSLRHIIGGACVLISFAVCVKPSTSCCATSSGPGPKALVSEDGLKEESPQPSRHL